MRYLLFLACLAIALAGCAGQLSPEASPTATEIAQAPSPTPTPSPTETSTPTPTASPFPTPTPTKTPTPLPTTTPKPTATPTPEPQVYVTVQQISTYASPGGEEHGYVIPGKRFVILEGSDGWLHIRLAKGAIVWIQASETAYYPEGEVPPPTPTPETPPAAVCEAPHFPDRTPDRKTGYIIFIGERFQMVRPLGVENVSWIRLDYIGGGIGWIRPAKIIEVDKQSQVITFDIGGEQSIRRRFTDQTIAIMVIHEVKRGQTEPWRIPGGNFCDLEVDDAVAIIHPDQREAVNPNPNLIDLWGVYFVQ